VTNSFEYEAIAKMIDHSLLNPSLTTRELEEGCALAAQYDVASVCILPYYLARCAELLAAPRSIPVRRLAFRMAAYNCHQAGRIPASARGRRQGTGCCDQHQQSAQRGLAVCAR